MAERNLIEVKPPCITVSIVSHGQGGLVASLLEDLSFCEGIFQVVLTLNISESPVPIPQSLKTRVRVIQNLSPKGFAANHNQAFRFCQTAFFAVLNPDVRLIGDPFPNLSLCLSTHSAGVIAPKVQNSAGRTEDSARSFPTVGGLTRKLFRLTDGGGRAKNTKPKQVDWAAGMFLLFSSSAFRKVGGFDEGFFLYYEDVDICARLWRGGSQVIYDPSVSVVHDAQRTSHRNLRYFLWHLQSLIRYFAKNMWRLPR